MRAETQRDGRLYFGAAEEPFLGSGVTDLTDKGLREINVLPPDAALAGLLAALDELSRSVEENSELQPDQKARKRGKLARMGEVLRETAIEIGPKILVEVPSPGMGL